MENNNNAEEFTKRKKEIGSKLRDSIQKLAILAISGIYIFNGIFQLTKSDASLLSILGNIGLSVIIGFALTELFRSNGLKDGRGSTLFENAINAYGKAKVEATPHLSKLHAWCEYKNAQDLESAKKTIIVSAGLSWKGYKCGYYKENMDRITDEQKAQIAKADKCTIEKIKSEELMSDANFSFKLGKKKFGGKFGRSEKEYQTVSAIPNFLMRIVVGVVCGLYTLYPVLSNEILAGVLWHSLQVVMWLVLGISKYSEAKYFMEYEYRQTHIIAKTEYLNEFRVTMEKCPEVVEDYDDEKIVDVYIQQFIDNKEKENNATTENDNEGVHN